MPRNSYRHAPTGHAMSPGSTIDAATFTAICLAACRRLPAMRRTAEATRLDRLVAAGAWIDAALALLAIELPAWRLRRLAYDEGAWHCALSKQPDMPDWLDDTIETHHPELHMAVLDAVRTAISHRGTLHLVSVPPMPAQPATELMSCENYA